MVEATCTDYECGKPTEKTPWGMLKVCRPHAIQRLENVLRGEPAYVA